MGGLVLEGKLWYRLKDDICTLAQLVLFSETVEKGQSNSYVKTE